MKTQSSFSDRISRIEAGATVGGMAIYQGGTLVQPDRPARRVHWDLLVLGGLAGSVAGTMFAQSLGLLFVMQLDWITFYGLMLSDYMRAVYVAACAIAPVGFLFTLLFNRTSPRAFQFWAAYTIGVLGGNHVDVRYLIEFVVIPGFWEFVGNYTTSKDVVNGAAATQPQL